MTGKHRGHTSFRHSWAWVQIMLQVSLFTTLLCFGFFLKLFPMMVTRPPTAPGSMDFNALRLRRVVFFLKRGLRWVLLGSLPIPRTGNHRFWECTTLQAPVTGDAESQPSDHNQQDAVSQLGPEGDVSELEARKWRSNPNTDSL